MKDRKLLIQKKADLIKVTKKMNKITAVSVIDFIESDSSDIKKYISEIQDICDYKACPPIATRKKEVDTKNTISWIQTKLPFLKNNVTWLIPCGERGMWWAKTRVKDYKEALYQLWEQRYDICIIDIENNIIFSVRINENEFEIAVKELV